MALSSSVLPLFDVLEAISVVFKFPNENCADEVIFAASLPNENVGVALTALLLVVVAVAAAAVVPGNEPNEKVLFGAADVAAELPNENCDFAGKAPLVVAQLVTSRDCSQQAHFDLDISFALRHAEHSHVLFCFSTIDLHALSTGFDDAGAALVEDEDNGNEPKLNVGFGGAALLSVTLFEEVAFGLAPPQQAHFDCAYKRNIKIRLKKNNKRYMYVQ